MLSGASPSTRFLFAAAASRVRVRVATGGVRAAMADALLGVWVADDAELGADALPAQ